MLNGRSKAIFITRTPAAVNAADLTTDKYTIRWYVFKYDTSDAWHVDGILVPRSGRLTVTKVFAGRDAPTGFSVTVDGSYQGAANRYELQMRPYTELDDAAPGYRSRTVGADGSVTYVWQVDVYDAVYRVRENGAAADGYTLDAAYEKFENGSAPPLPRSGRCGAMHHRGRRRGRGTPKRDAVQPLPSQPHGHSQ